MPAPGAPTVTAAMVAAGRTVADPQLSPDGSEVAFVSVRGGRAELVVVPAPGGSERVVAADPPPRGAPAYGGGVLGWAPDGRSLVYAGADGGVWQVPAGGGPGRRVAVARRPSGPVVSPSGDLVAYVDDEQDVAVAPLDPEAGWPVRVSSGPGDFRWDPSWSADGAFVAWHEWDDPDMPWDASRWALAPADGSGVVARRQPEGAAVQQPRFAPVGTDLAYLSDASGWTNLWLFGPGREPDAPFMAEPHEHGDAPQGPGQRTFAWAPDASRVVLSRNENGFGRLVVVDIETARPVDVARGVHGALSWRGGHVAAVRSGARTPHQLVVYDTTSWTPTVVARGPVGGWEDAGLVEPEVVSWSAPDGAEIPGRLYRPVTGEDPPPLLVWIHGGPTAQWPVAFNPRVAYFVARGWAVLLPDHRGSTGHGRAFLRALDGGWGRTDVADVAAGMQAAAERGWGHPRRMVPIGGSAGGFTALNLAVQAPERCAAVVAAYPVSDLLHTAEETHRFERHYFERIVGPLPAAVDEYRARSPLAAAERIRCPLLVLHGTQDPVVPFAHSRDLVDRVRATGGTAELRAYEGEGHGWKRPEVVRDELEQIETFLDREVRRWQG